MQHHPYSTNAVRLRILGRRIGNHWNAIPEWMRDGLTAWAIGQTLWLLLVAVLLVF